MIERNPRILPFRWLEAISCTKPSKAVRMWDDDCGGGQYC